MRIALAQIDTTAGDVRGNEAAVRAAWERARSWRADLVVFPELALVGYPPRDLLLRESVVRAAEAALARLADAFRTGPAALVGTVARNPRPVGPALVNAAVLLREGAVAASYAKRLLPTYDVFDERRYFAPGDAACTVEVAGRRVGLLICEDLWVRDPLPGRRLYEADPPAELAAAGVDLVVAISASPYHGHKDAHRTALFAAEARRMGVPLVTLNLVGGNDDVLFDGRSRVFDAAGREALRLAAFAPDLRLARIEDDGRVLAEDAGPGAPPAPAAQDLAPPEELRRALVMGLADYAAKTGFGRALVGLSGGIDSSVVACLAAEALGPEQVLAVAMPGPFTSPASNEDAAALTASLGLASAVVPIAPPYEAFLEVLRPHFAGRGFDVAEENLQARARGTILMALSNKLGHLVLTTGNKSELAVGYCTLYGDMNGGLAVISDVWKTQVRALGRLYAQRGWVPERVLRRPPSAELRADQRDSDSLPPYEVLDPILEARVERGASLQEIVEAGTDREVAERVLRLIERSEYKRRQMAPGLKVTPTAFGVGWRMPIARPVDLSGEL